MITWQLLALIFSFFGAAIIHANHVYKIDGFTAVFLRGFMMLLLGVPLGMFLGAPTELAFYGWAAITGVLITGADVMLLNASAKHGGRLTAMYIPLKMFFVFIEASSGATALLITFFLAIFTILVSNPKISLTNILMEKIFKE